MVVGDQAMSATTTASPSIVIIGAGFAGICMAIQLRKAGIHDFVILEAAARWQAGHPGAPIVCIGPLHNGAQARVAALECIYVVDHAQDFAAIRDGIARSTARLLQGSQR